MGTQVVLAAYTSESLDEATLREKLKKAHAEIKRLELLMTTWRDDSEISRVNAAAGKKPVTVGPESLAVIQKSIWIGKESSGVFDITFEAMHGLWKFDEGAEARVPDKKDIEKARKLIDYRNIELDAEAHSVRLKKEGVRINLGGIAKGYAVDRARKIVDDEGLVDYILRAGGDLYVSGVRGNRQWVVGIRDPRGAPDDSFAAAPLSNVTFSTSGDYERFVIVDGVRYFHILDPKTAYPAWKSRSVTVMAKDAMTADAWSKPLFIMGAAAGMKLVEKLPDLEAVFVDDKHQVHVSSGLQSKLKILHAPKPGI